MKLRITISNLKKDTKTVKSVKSVKSAKSVKSMSLNVVEARTFRDVTLQLSTTMYLVMMINISSRHKSFHQCSRRALV